MKRGNQLFTDLFITLTEAHQYLHASSCHVSHFKKSIPLNQAYVLTEFVLKKPF